MWRVKHNLRTRGRALALAVVLAASTAGCSVFSPFQTAETQSIGDGVAVEGLPDVQVENLALVTGDEGGDAVVTGTVENSGSDPVTFTIAVGDSEASTTVDPNSLVTLGDDADLTLSGLEEGAGTMVDVEVTAVDQTVPLLVPAVAPTGYYRPYAPEGWTPEPSPSSTAGEESEEH